MEVNLYFQYRLTDNISVLGAKGGTLGTNAAQLTHLVRYCYENNISFLDLNDSDFFNFIEHLKYGKKKLSKHCIKIRTDANILAIGRLCLDFLSYLGKKHFMEDFVSESGCIHGKRQKNKRTNRKYGECWHHGALPLPQPTQYRSAISDDYISELYAATNAIFKKHDSGTFQEQYIRERRKIMLTLLEITGGRRQEIALLDISDIHFRSDKTHPHVVLRTLKHINKNEFRVVPISDMDASAIDTFIKAYRAKLFKIYKGKFIDDNALLSSSTTGKRLSENTITQEISILARFAGIDAQCCPHMFRHKAIIKWVANILHRYQLSSSDDFEQGLISIDGLKTSILQLTGQKSLASLNHYIGNALTQLKNGIYPLSNIEIDLIQIDGIKRLLNYGQDVDGNPLTDLDIAKAILPHLRELNSTGRGSLKLP
ncbi:site-specific integrase [Silvimonas sp.]|uniref:site-specific integrase n=1 Tax=Silvimonas sp. TaxID=2650811 RepID=UPI0028475F0A|nr:site-specific integrase [Silvimonas sp.]MDR3427731.1 site-specific integrase [Silvimonas sp.]